MFEFNLPQDFDLSSLSDNFKGGCVSLTLTPSSNLYSLKLPATSKLYLKKAILNIKDVDFARTNIKQKLSTLNKHFDLVCVYCDENQLSLLNKYEFDIIKFDFEKILTFKQKELNQILNEKYLEVEFSNSLNFLRNMHSISGYIKKEKVIFSSYKAKNENDLIKFETVKSAMKAFNFKTIKRPEEVLEDIAMRKFVKDGVVVEDEEKNIFKEHFVMNNLYKRFK